MSKASANKANYKLTKVCGICTFMSTQKNNIHCIYHEIDVDFNGHCNKFPSTAQYKKFIEQQYVKEQLLR